MLMETRGSHGSLLRPVLERSRRGERLRRRFAAIAAAVVFVLGLTAAVGSMLLVLTVLGVLMLAALVLAAREQRADRVVLLRLRSFARRDVQVLLPRGRRVVVDTLALVRTSFSGAQWPSHGGGAGCGEEATVEMAVVQAPPSVLPVSRRLPHPAWSQVADRLSELLPALERRIGSAIPGLPRRAEDAVGVADVEGSRCNALGLALRRAGRTQQAAALHEAALLIFARLGDRRAEALAANALGVALVEIGDHDGALEQFERARALLHELGDRHWEGKVLANIGLAKHRVGRDDEALEHLQIALANLSPETEAYRLVERRLKLAS
jgi:hypothetical protein